MKPLVQMLQFICAFSLLLALAAHTEPVDVHNIIVVDGDTIDVRGERFRLVGYDTPEISTPRRKVSADERAVATIAKERFVELLNSGSLDLTEVRCACVESTIGTKRCNHGRKCGLLTLNGKNIGDTLIREGLAMPFVCSATRCPRMPDWETILREQQ